MSDGAQDAKPAAPTSPRGSSKESPPPDATKSSWLVTYGVNLLLVLSLVGCCICGGGSFFFRPRFNADPGGVTQLTNELATIAIPPLFEPRGTIDWNLAYMMSMRGAYYDVPNDAGMLMLLRVNARLASKPRVRAHIRKTLEEEGAGGSPLIVEETKLREIAIGGHDVPVSIERGRDPATRTEYYVVEAVLDDSRGSLLIALRLRDDVWDASQIITMLESIQVH